MPRQGQAHLSTLGVFFCGPTISELDMATRRLYLPMRNREYCVTESEQKDLARMFGMGLDRVRNAMLDLRHQIESGEVELGRTANTVKRQIQAKLNTER